MVPIQLKIKKFFTVQLSEEEEKKYSSDDVRRIQMVNTISLLGVFNLLLYGIVYSFINFSVYWVAIVFYFVTALLTLCILFINKLRYYNLAKVLVASIFPLYLTINSVFLFGKMANSQVYLLLFALIPLFIYGFKQKTFSIFFIVLNLLLYLMIDFFPALTEPMYGVPSAFIDFFRSLNVFIAFMGAFVAILYFKKFSYNKEQQLVKQAQELKLSVEHRDLVYSIIAHDLRTPLNGLIGISQLLANQMDEMEKAKIKNLLGAMHESASNLNNLLANLLDWAKMHSGNLKPNFKSLNLKNTVDEVLHLLRDSANQKGLLLTTEVDANITVMADMYMISTIIRNLLANAIKFTSKGGSIAIKAEKKDSHVVVSISDNGVGIPHSKIESLFSLNSTHVTLGTNKEKGSGLGLKVCHDFVLAHGGKIWVESHEGRGSIFFFTLSTHV